MNIFKNKLETSEYDLLIMQNSHCHVYAKDHSGKYLYVNRQLCLAVGFNKETDMSGLTDFDITCLSEQQALHLRENDSRIMAKEYAGTFFEPITLITGKEVVAISHKSPLRNRYEKVIGITGMSFIVEKNELFSSHDLFSFKHNVLEFDSMSLSKREIEILKQVLKGKTAKQTAMYYNLSVRTVENYLHKIKIKLNVKSKSELIDLFDKSSS